MKYPEIRYDRTDAVEVLQLYSFDGTYRMVTFRDGDAAVAALADGRASADVVAVQSGFLPRGATFVSRAHAPEARALMTSMGDRSYERDPLAAIRLAFSLRLLVDRSRDIDGRSNQRERLTHSGAARRYEALVDALLAHRP